jgi:hypothetical protein
MHAQKIEVSSATDKYCAKSEDLVPRVSNSSQLVIHSPCIPYIPELGERVGVYAAILLQQLHYWIQKDCGQKKDGKLWVYNSYEAWAKQLRCSSSNIRKIVGKLKKENLIETKALRSRYGDTTKWYTVNYEALKELGFTLHSDIILPHESTDSISIQGTCLALNENKVTNQNKKTLVSQSPENKVNNRVSQSDIPLNKISKIINNLSPTEVGSNYQKMITIWNEIVHQGSQTVKVTERRIKWLKRRFKLEFQSCLEKWKAYCLMIAENDFLMGMGKKGWKATLDWAILPPNIQKVLSNAYQHLIRPKKEDPQAKEGSEKPLCSHADIEAENQEAIKKIETSFHPLFWKEVSKSLLLTLGSRKFESWISQLIPEFSQGNEVILNAPSRFIADWVEKNYAETILSTCQKLDKKIHKLEFRNGDRTPQANGVLQENNQQEMQKTARFIEGSHHSGFWKEVCKHLLSKLGVGKFKSWIPQLSLQTKYQDTLVLKAASQGSLVWLKRNFADSILECCQKLDPKIRYLEFTCE